MSYHNPQVLFAKWIITKTAVVPDNRCLENNITDVWNLTYFNLNSSRSTQSFGRAVAQAVRRWLPTCQFYSECSLVCLSLWICSRIVTDLNNCVLNLALPIYIYTIVMPDENPKECAVSTFPYIHNASNWHYTFKYLSNIGSRTFATKGICQTLHVTTFFSNDASRPFDYYCHQSRTEGSNVLRELKQQNI
jgi:hypothetical protein